MIILHVDMDAFYASVEMITRPELRAVPMFVGGGDRGVVLSANYPARKFGISGGMPASRASRLCPQAIVIRPDFEKYTRASNGVFEILESITEQVERASIDEGFLDITGSIRRLGSPEEIGQLIRSRVAVEQRIPCTVGIGPNRFVAKLASNHAKPDGLLYVSAPEVIDFLHPLPVEAIWGVGEVTAAKLKGFGFHRVADLAHTPKSTLQLLLGKNQGASLHELAWGREPPGMSRTVRERTIGAQTTFSVDSDDPAVIRRELLRMSARTASRLRAAGWCASSLNITIRFEDFTDLTRTSALPGPTDVTDDLYSAAVRLLNGIHLANKRIRLVGVRAEKLIAADQANLQPTLDEQSVGMRAVEKAVDQMTNRFGSNAVQRASLTRIDSES